jgi:mannan endo-1,4-beta-mannosidase
VLRFWAFQSYAGASGMDFSHFDRLVVAARAAGVRLIPVLENMQHDCSSGAALDDTWFASGYKSPYGNYALSYRDYVSALVTHFRSEPTIIAWELMHEASGDQFAALDAFAEDMTTLIRAADTNHLIALGLNNGDSAATSTDGDPSNYVKLQDRAEVDLVDVQDFNAPGEPLPAQVALCRSLTHALGKVAFMGASAATLSDASSAAMKVRASEIASKLDAALAAEFRGFLVYDYAPKWQSPSYEFDSRPGEPLAGPNGVLAQRAPQY